VNGDNPEAVVHAAHRHEFRQLFHKDVVIDMNLLIADRSQ